MKYLGSNITVIQSALHKMQPYFLALVYLLCSSSFALGKENQSDLITLKGNALGTTYQIKYYAPPFPADSKQLTRDIDVLFERLNAQMSNYAKDSELLRFNASQTINQPFPISPEFRTVVEKSLYITSVTDGGLDITLLPLIELWGFGSSSYRRDNPSDTEVSRALEQTGMKHLELHKEGLVKHLPDIRIDVSAIAKGYSVDLIAQLLDEHGIKDFLIEVGGEIRAKGSHLSRPWIVGIQIPPTQANNDQAYFPIALNDLSMATSGVTVTITD